jgi:hypothetical protein
MNTNSLATYVARCDGVQYEEGDWREDCDRCLRRIASRSEGTPMMVPPKIIVFECEYLIEETK